MAPMLLSRAVLLGLLAPLLSPFFTPDRVSAEWSAVAESKVSSTDDAFQFSSARRQKFSEDPSQPTVVPVEKKSDVVWDPSLEVIRSSSNNLGATELSFKAQGFVYTNNPIFNHGNYRLQLTQALTPDTTILFRYRYTPNLFLGPNFERRTGNKLIEEERVTSHVWRTEIDRRLSDVWKVTFIGRFGLRFYDDVFAERDTKFWTGGPQVEYAVVSGATVTLGYLFERGVADGRGDMRFNDDVSYRQHAVSLAFDSTLTERWSLHLLYLYRRKDFTTDLVGDTHLNRHDNTHQGAAEVRYRINETASATVGFQHSQRTSTNELRNFNDTIYSLGGQYRF